MLFKPYDAKLLNFYMVEYCRFGDINVATSLRMSDTAYAVKLVGRVRII